MVLGTPITWLIADIVALLLFVVCVVHASRQENAIIKILELFGFLMFSAMFENIGVASGRYNYDLHRIMLVGKVPLQIILLEGVIFYVALRFAEYLRIPKWGIPFVVGLFGMMQDLTLDPSVIYDRYLFDGVMSAQWNWALHYDGSFFGIPFFNFSGWYWFMVWYVIGSMIISWIYQKIQKDVVLYLYPFLATLISIVLLAVVPITGFMIDGTPLFPTNSQAGEILFMAINLLIGLFILLRYQKIDRPFDFAKDWPIFFIPIFLHLYDLLIAVVFQISVAYLPIIVVGAVHITYLMYVYLKGKGKVKGLSVQTQPG